jgi:hypothetical protein
MPSQKHHAIDFYIVDEGTEFSTEFTDPARFGVAVAYLNAALGERLIRTPDSGGVDEVRPVYVLNSEQYRAFRTFLG